MSLDIRRNSYTRLLFQEIYYFKILLSLLTKCETYVYYPNPGGYYNPILKEKSFFIEN